jgi:two-component system cell cycle response regulator
VAPNRTRILVVDDSRSQLDWLAQVLLRDGYDVVTAATGREAIVKARTLAQIGRAHV